jgi:hypothetical protein
MRRTKIAAFIAFTAASAFLLVVKAQNQNVQTQERERKLLTLQAEPQQISAGAEIDLEIQKNPNLFRVPARQAAPPSERTPPAAGLVNPLAPPLGTNFNGINFDDDAATTGFYLIPPDPSGAAGPTHVVNVVNSTIEWYTKAGVMENRQRLASHPSLGVVGSFFASLAPLTSTFDPKVIYDQYSERFIVTTMERTEFNAMTGATNTSRVFVAVSDDSDPNGTWYFLQLNTEELIGAGTTWADFPGLAVDSEAIYFTNNQFRHNNQPSPGTLQGQRLWIIAKAPFYSGGVATATRYDPTALANANPAGDGAVPLITMQPTQMHGDAPGGVGNYLMAYSGINDGTNVAVQMIQVDDPLTAPTFTGYFSAWGTIAADDSLTVFPGAPQSGTTRLIATGDRRFSQNAVYRDGSLYCAAPIRRPTAAPADANQVTVHWFKIDPVVIATPVNDPPPTDQGNIGGEDIAVGTYTFFPSVAVNCAGDLAIGFAASAPSIFPGSYYTARLAADPAGTTQPAGTLRAGVDYYIRDFTTSMTVASRWGDYTGIWLDPSDERTFWLFNESALTRGTNFGGSFSEEDGRWGTAWGGFIPPGPPPCPLQLTSAISLKKHGTGGAGSNRSIPMPLTATLVSGTSGVEDRQGGDSDGGGPGDYKIVLTFNNPVTGGTASATAHNPGGAGGSAGAVSFSGNEMIIPLTGVTNAQVLTVTAANVTDGATFVSSVDINIGFLIGDSTGNRTVSNTDVSMVKAQVGAPVNSSNFRDDVNANGIISNTDVTLTKAQVGTPLP